MSEEMRLGEYAWDHVPVDNRQADRILESPNTHSAQRVVQTENPLGEKKWENFRLLLHHALSIQSWQELT